MNKIKRICIVGMIVAISFILDYFSITLPLLKITLYALPLVINGILFGYKYGLLAGFIEGLLSQIFSKYGFQITALLWMIAPILWGVLSALFYQLFNKQKKILKIILSVLITSIIVSIINTIIIYIDGIIWNYPIAFTNLNILFRILNSILTSLIYSLLLILIIPTLEKFVHSKK